MTSNDCEVYRVLVFQQASGRPASSLMQRLQRASCQPAPLLMQYRCRQPVLFPTCWSGSQPEWKSAAATSVASARVAMVSS